MKIDEKGLNKPDFREIVKELRDLRRLRELRILLTLYYNIF